MTGYTKNFKNTGIVALNFVESQPAATLCPGRVYAKTGRRLCESDGILPEDSGVLSEL